VNERVNALADNVEAFGLLLIIEMLELHNPLEEKLVSEFELPVRDPTLVHDANGDNKLAVVQIISLWK
jgi:hypothetical protein